LLSISLVLCYAINTEAVRFTAHKKFANQAEDNIVSAVTGREGASKIFQMPLSAKLVTQNRMNKTPVLGALSTASAARRAEAAALEVRGAAQTLTLNLIVALLNPNPTLNPNLNPNPDPDPDPGLTITGTLTLILTQPHLQT